MPREGDVHFCPSSLNDDHVLASRRCCLFAVSVVEGGPDIAYVVVVSAGSGVHHFRDGRQLLLDFGEGAVELVLLAETVLALEAHVGGVALGSQAGEGEEGESKEREVISTSH